MHLAVRSGRFVFVAQWVFAVLLPIFFFIGRGVVGAQLGWLSVLGVIYGFFVIVLLLVPPMMTLFDRTVRRQKRTRWGYALSTIVLWAASRSPHSPCRTRATALRSTRRSPSGPEGRWVGCRGVDLRRVRDHHRPRLRDRVLVRARRHRALAFDRRELSGRSVRRLGALWRSTHPGPRLVVSAVAVLLGLAVGLARGDWWCWRWRSCSGSSRSGSPTTRSMLAATG